MANLSVNFAGLQLANPLIASAGPITANAEHIKKLEEAGIGAIVTKTGFTKKEYERWVGRSDIFPYKPAYKYMSLKDGTLLCLPTLSDVPVSETAKRIERMKRDLNIPIIASIMGLSLAGYRESARIVEDAGADAIELDLCCPLPEFTTLYRYAGQNASLDPKVYAQIIKCAKKAVSIPVGVKSTVSLYVSPRILNGLIRSKLANRLPDFLTVVGQLDQNPGVDLETLKPLIPHIPSFGWEGELHRLTYSALAVFSSALGTTNPALSASGGIRDYQGVVQAMALGATTVQFQTAILDKGPAVISKILKDLNSYLDARGLSRLDQIVGIGSKDCIPASVLGEFMLARDTLYGVLCAAVDAGLCTGCETCARVCTENAITVKDKKAVIEKAKCRACNLCVLKCPVKAISLDNIVELEKLMDKYKHSEKASALKGFMNKKKIGRIDALLFIRQMKKWGLV
ncbi:4Fe-4S binding protein [Candidatus Poribacteria bacterium]|nr:4Fe-4S binding protein [Candidatus Poribacteria bacterium]